jgi:hypothetical protein
MLSFEHRGLAPETGAALATYKLEPAHGHNVLLGKGARRIANDVIAWVDALTGSKK